MKADKNGNSEEEARLLVPYNLYSGGQSTGLTVATGPEPRSAPERRPKLTQTASSRRRIMPREASFRVPLPFTMPSESYCNVDDKGPKEFKYIDQSKERGFGFFKKLYKNDPVQEEERLEEEKLRDAREKKISQWKTLLAGILVVIAIFVDGLRPITLVWAKDGAQKYPFVFSVWIIMVKALVIGFSVLMYFLSPLEMRTTDLGRCGILKYSMYLVPPTLLYLTSDLLNFYMFEYISASTFSIVKQSRLVIVGLLFRFALGRYLSQIQWVAIGQLLLSSILFEADKFEAPVTPGPPGLSNNNEAIGVAILLFKCLLDSLAIVWMDKYFKLLETVGFPYPLQQIYFAVYGFLFGVLVFFVQEWDTLGQRPLLDGWTVGAWVSAMLSAFYGVLVSLVLRYLDSLVKMLQSLLAVIVTIAFDNILFGERIDTVKSIAICFVLISVFLYKLGTVKHKI